MRPGKRRLSHTVGIDDAPFAAEHRGDVLVIGAVFAGSRLDGVLSTTVRRDGTNATARLAHMIGESRFARQLHVILLQGIALAGFNVVDLESLHRQTGLGVLVVARRPPNLARIRAALLSAVRGGRRKWLLIEKAGPMAPLEGVWVQRVGLDEAMAAELIRRLAVTGAVPEPLRTAHLIAGGVGRGHSRGRT